MTIGAYKPLEVERFAKWLGDQGAELLGPTNEWEVLRFKIGGWIGILHCGKRGVMRPNNPDTAEAWKCWKTGTVWQHRVKRKNRVQGSKAKARLLERDGDVCFYCGEPLGDDITVEHFVAIAHGGGNHMSNLALAHKKCNSIAGNLSVVEKVALREQMHADVRRERI